MSGLSDWFAVFCAGTHTDSKGRTATFTREDLDGIVDAYDPEQPSPCVITHQELYSPFGYAQVEALRRDGDMLQARCAADSIEPQFASLVEDGRLHNRSVQLLPQADGGGYRMGHVAFLGAEPPAVEGLAPISFSTAGLDFSSETAWDRAREARNIARLFAVVRRLAEKVFGLEGADAIVSRWEETEAAEESGALRERALHMPDQEGGAMKTYSQTEFDAALSNARTEARAAAERDTANRGRIARLVDAGRITPAQAEGLAEFAAQLPAGDVLEFSRAAGEGQTSEQVQTSPAEFIFSLLESLPERQIVRAPLAADNGPGREAGESAAAIRSRAHEFMAEERKRGRIINIAQAVRHVTGDAT